MTALPTPTSEPSPPAVSQTERALAKSERRRNLAAMRERAVRLRWRTAKTPRPKVERRTVRLWLPVTPFLILLSPLLLLGLGIAVFLPRPIGVNPAHVVLGVGRMLLALSGTQVEVENDTASVHLKFF